MYMCVCVLQGLLKYEPQGAARRQTLFKVAIQSATLDAKSFATQDLLQGPVLPRLFP